MDSWVHDRCFLICRLLALVAVSVTPPVAARAQDWPSAPITALDGRFTLGGDLTLTAGTDDLGYFNFTDYERSALRLARIDLVTTFRASDRISFFCELRSEGDLWAGHWSASPYAAYVRLKPWRDRAFEIQAGRLPSAFGGFIRRSYGPGNPLIGYPLAYQYLTSLREDSVPANADQLLAGRARGWYIAYPVGDQAFENGVPVVSAFRYDTGVLARVGSSRSRAEWLTSVTTGTLSYPLVRDDNGAPQVATRVVVRPVIGLALGASAARGAFLTNGVRAVLPGSLGQRQYPQRAFGADVEYSRDHWLVRSEAVLSAWSLPAIDAPAIDDDLGARSWLAEGRYTIRPDLYIAARYDWLGFSRVTGTRGTDTWDANVWRTEVGAGYRVTRTVTVKASVQHNRRDGGRTRDTTLGAAQMVLWF